MEERLERRHVLREEAPVLADAVAAHRRRALAARSCCRNSISCARPRLRRRVEALTRSIRPLRPCVPLFQASIAVERRIALVDREHRAFDAARPSCASVTTTAISMMRSVSGYEARHLEVDPDRGSWSSSGSRSSVIARALRDAVADSAGRCRSLHSPPHGLSRLTLAVRRAALMASLAGTSSSGSRRARCATSRAHRDAVPAAFAARVTLAAHQQRRRLHAGQGALRPAGSWSSGAAVLLGWTLLGGLDALERLRCATRSQPRWGGSMAYELALRRRLRARSAPSLDLPFDWYAHVPPRAALRLQPHHLDASGSPTWPKGSRSPPSIGLPIALAA